MIPWVLEDVAKLKTALQPAHLDDNMEANPSRLCSPANTMAWSVVKAFLVQGTIDLFHFIAIQGIINNYSNYTTALF